LPYASDVPLVGTPAYAASPASPSLPPFDLTSGKFSTNSNLCPGTGQDAANQWTDQLISGRYAQKYDPKAGFWEGLTSIPLVLSSAPDYKVRGLLPHRNEIAVDSGTPGKEHRLYSDAPNPTPDDRNAFTNQFRWRVNTAIAHIRQAFDDNGHGSQPGNFSCSPMTTGFGTISAMPRKRPRSAPSCETGCKANDRTDVQRPGSPRLT
jgi:hypothetical protein